jgi:hypothetical protein
MIRTVIERIAGLLELSGAFAASAVMFGCFCFGFVQIGDGFVGLVRQLFTGTKVSATGNGLLNATLTGLEMFFLAPLPFLAFFSISRLFRAAIGNDPSELQRSKMLVVEVKQLIVGLMIAVVSTELIHRISTGTELTPIATLATIGLIAVLSLYYWSSHRGMGNGISTNEKTNPRELPSPHSALGREASRD